MPASREPPGPAGDPVIGDEIDRAIVRMVLDGATNKAIARAVGLAEGTIKWRLHRLYGRVGATSRTAFALRIRELIGEP